MKCFIVLFLFGSLLHKNVSALLKVSIYYEALCPDSVLFITRDLNPVYSVIADYIDLDFVPYGKATQQYHNGKWLFSCQHGQSECFANKMQACALHQNSTQANNLKFVDCVMKYNRFYRYNPQKVLKCTSDSGLSAEDLSECMRTDLKDTLLAKHGAKTLSLDSVLTFVPTIVFNDKYDGFLQNDALEDLLATVCGQLNEPLPTGCRKKRQSWMFW